MAYTISKDKSKLNIDAIHNYLCHKSYWAKGRSLERVKKSIDNSISFGIYNDEDKQMGFARVVTDKVVFAYLMDFFIFEEFRGRGYGKELIKYIQDYPEFQVRLWFLGTADAHGLYEEYGFTNLDDPKKFMFKRNEDYC